MCIVWVASRTLDLFIFINFYVSWTAKSSRYPLMFCCHLRHIMPWTEWSKKIAHIRWLIMLYLTSTNSSWEFKEWENLKESPDKDRKGGIYLLQNRINLQCGWYSKLILQGKFNIIINKSGAMYCLSSESNVLFNLPRGEVNFSPPFSSAIRNIELNLKMKW